MEKDIKYKFNYFYKITNLINNKYYYGVHSTNNLNDGYMGSGKLIIAAYKKYGIENFKKEILKYFDSRLEMFEYEHLLVNEEIIKDPLCYNLIIGGLGDISLTKIQNLITVSEDNGNTWMKISSDEYKKNKEKYFVPWKNTVTVSIDNGKTWFNLDLAEYKKNKNMYITTGTNKVPVSIDNGKTWFKIDSAEYRKNKDNYITTTKNKVTVKDKVGKIYSISRDDARYLSGDLVPIWTGKHHRDEIKEKIRKTMTPKNSKNPRIWVSKNGKFKYLRKELLEDYLNNGWVKGRIKM